jgi:hypothetical protein
MAHEVSGLIGCRVACLLPAEVAVCGLLFASSGCGIAAAALLDVTKVPYQAVVNDGGYDTLQIQAAINAAAPGDAVYFPLGEYLLGEGNTKCALPGEQIYRCNLLVDKGITLRFAPGATLKAVSSNSASRIILIAPTLAAAETRGRGTCETGFDAANPSVLVTAPPPPGATYVTVSNASAFIDKRHVYLCMVSGKNKDTPHMFEFNEIDHIDVSGNKVHLRNAVRSLFPSGESYRLAAVDLLEGVRIERGAFATGILSTKPTTYVTSSSYLISANWTRDLVLNRVGGADIALLAGYAFAVNNSWRPTLLRLELANISADPNGPLAHGIGLTGTYEAIVDHPSVNGCAQGIGIFGDEPSGFLTLLSPTIRNCSNAGILLDQPWSTDLVDVNIRDSGLCYVKGKHCGEVTGLKLRSPRLVRILGGDLLAPSPTASAPVSPNYANLRAFYDNEAPDPPWYNQSNPTVEIHDTKAQNGTSAGGDISLWNFDDRMGTSLKNAVVCDVNAAKLDYGVHGARCNGRYSGKLTLDPPAIAANAKWSHPLTIAGVQAGMIAMVGTKNPYPLTAVRLEAAVEATDTVTLTWRNLSAMPIGDADLPSATYWVDVIAP